MNTLQKAVARLLGIKDTSPLYSLHPELLERVPILRATSEGEGAVTTQSALDTYATHVWVHKAIDTVAQTIAPLPVRVVNEADGQPIANHVLTTLLKRVNDSMSSSDLWRQWVVNMLLGGECGLEIIGTQEVWPHSADEFEVRVQRGQARYGRVLGYRIQDNQGQPYELPPAEFIHFKFYNPRNQWRGLSPLSAVRMGVLIDQYAQAWSWYFFRNQARPDYVLITPQGLAATERDELETKLSAKFGGIENSHKPIVLEQGITDIKPLGWAPKDSEWAAQREMSRQEIGAIFGVPDEIMGFGKDTYENLRFGLTALYQLTVLPLCSMRDETLTNHWQATGELRESQRLTTDVSGIEILQADKGPKVLQAVQLFGLGVPMRIINEKLGLDLGKYDGDGIGYLTLSLTPTNYMPGEKPPKPEPPPPAPAPPPPPAREPTTEPTGETPAQPEDTTPPETPVETTPKAMHKGIEYGSVLHRQIWLLFKARTDPGESSVKRVVKKQFQAEESDVLRAARSDALDLPAMSPEEWAALTDAERAAIIARILAALLARAKVDAAWRATMTPVITDIVTTGGEHAIEAAGLSIAFDLLNPEVIKLLKQIIWDFSEEVGDATQALLEKLLEDSITEGLSIPKIADAIAEIYDGFKGPRAERIARTETLKAFNGGAFNGYKQSGAPRKEWISALDDRTRTPPDSDFDHVAAHGEIVKMDEPFTLTGEDLMFPGDPSGSAGNIINCRCTFGAVWEDEKRG